MSCLPARSAFPAWAGAAERLRYFLGYAVRAPSRHNSQPWLFEIEGDELRILVDWRRSLKAADPRGREMVMACGAALENVRLGAAHHGHEVDVQPVAGGREADLVARVRLGERRAPEEADERLFAAIPQRRTAALFRSTDVDQEVLEAMAREVAAEGCTLRQVRPSRARPVAELVVQADAVQWASARFRAELAVWSRGGARRQDGFVVPPGGPPAKRLRRLLSTFGRARRELDRRIAAQTRTLLVISTRGDEPRDWLAAGRAMQRALLRGASEGLLASHLSQAIEVPEARQQLRRTLFEPGYPQLLFRVGYGPVPRATPRRPVALVLRSFTRDVEVDVPLVEAPLVEVPMVEAPMAEAAVA
jgi:hypothetical protein